MKSTAFYKEISVTPKFFWNVSMRMSYNLIMAKVLVGYQPKSVIPNNQTKHVFQFYAFIYLLVYNILTFLKGYVERSYICVNYADKKE